MNNPKHHPNRDRYFAILRNMTPQQKIERVFELNELGKELIRAGLRNRHPDLPEREVNKKAVEKWLHCHNRNY
jgi:hypothetical protein